MPKAPPPPDFTPTEPPDTVISHEALPPGAHVGGYQIVEVLGDGAFGLVYLASDLSLQREVAIKEYLPVELAVRRDNLEIALRPSADAANFKNGMAAFLSEARLLARFEHPAIPRVLTFWEEHHTAYIAMPYYEGHSLATLVKNRRQPPTEAWVRGVIEPLLGALDLLHAAKCLQRDVTPGNIFILPDGRPMLLDFSAAARALEGGVQPFTALVDPAFAPLELYGETPSLPQGPWTDLYALGAVAYYAITGRLPMAATSRAIDDTQPTLAGSVKALRTSTHPNLHYSDALVTAIDQALAIKPQARPQNAAEFKALLDGTRAATAAPAASASAPSAATDDKPDETLGEKDEFGLTIIRDNWVNDGPPPVVPRKHHNAAPWIALLALAVGGGAWWWSSSNPLERTASRPAVQQIAPPSEAAPWAAPAAASNAAFEVAEAAIARPTSASTASAPVAFSSAPLLAATAASAIPLGAPLPAASAVTPITTVVVGRRAAEPQAKVTSAPVSVASASNTAALAEAAPATPRQACAPRTQFSLFYCMQTQCRSSRFSGHAQCVDLRRRGELD